MANTSTKRAKYYYRPERSDPTILDESDKQWMLYRVTPDAVHYLSHDGEWMESVVTPDMCCFDNDPSYSQVYLYQVACHFPKQSRSNQ